MEIIQILATAGALSVLALVVGLWIQNKIKTSTSVDLPYTALVNNNLRDVMKEVETLNNIIKKAKVLPEDATIDLDTVAKPKKRKKYYPKKPKTQL